MSHQHQERRQIWLEAERYHIAEVAEIFIPHPEGLPTISRNCLVVGYPGVGKTMILKKLCSDLSANPAILPIYVQIEPWAAKISGEITYPIERRQTPRDRQLVTSCTILLALGIIERVSKYASPELVNAATALFPGHHPDAHELSSWMDTQVSVVRRVLEDGDPLPSSHASFRTLFEFANAIGEAARLQGKTIVFLVDQVDKTSAVHFNTVASLLRRGEYVVVVATRPCPSAPDAATLPAGLVVGNDYAVHWVGSNPRSLAWRTFITDIVRGGRFPDQVANAVLRNVRPLTSLIGPSARTVLVLCLDMERRLLLGAAPEDAWIDAVTALLDSEESVATALMAGWCADPRRILARFKDRAEDARKRVAKGPGPASIKIRRTELLNQRDVDAFLRVCTREGLLLPESRQQHGLEQVLDEYEIAPLLVASRDPASLAQFDDELVPFEVTSAELDRWTSSGGRRRGRAQKKIFVSYWMTAPDAPGQLAERLKRGLLGQADVVTGRRIYGSPQWSAEIRSLIKDADVVVVELAAPRRDVFVEWGWAIGAKKQVLLGAPTSRAREANPRWAKERQIRLFEHAADFGEFLAHLIHMLNTYPSRMSTWIDDPSTESMNYRPSLRTVGFITAGVTNGQDEEVCVAACKENGFEWDRLSIGDGDNEAGVLFQVIRLARRCGTLVLHFNDTTNDLLLCIAAGVFTIFDAVPMGRRKAIKKIFLASRGAASVDVFPGLIKTKPGTATATSLMDVAAFLRQHLTQLNRFQANQRRRGRGGRGR